MRSFLLSLATDRRQLAMDKRRQHMDKRRQHMDRHRQHMDRRRQHMDRRRQHMDRRRQHMDRHRRLMDRRPLATHRRQLRVSRARFSKARRQLMTAPCLGMRPSLGFRSMVRADHRHMVRLRHMGLLLPLMVRLHNSMVLRSRELSERRRLSHQRIRIQTI